MSACSTTSLKSTHHHTSTRYPSAYYQLVCETDDHITPTSLGITSSFEDPDHFSVSIKATDQESGVWGIQYAIGHKMAQDDKSWKPKTLNFKNVTFDSIPQGGHFSAPSPKEHTFRFSIKRKKEGFILTYAVIDGCFNISPLYEVTIRVCPEGQYQCTEEACCPI